MSASTQRASYSVAWAGGPLGEPTADWGGPTFSTADTLEVCANPTALANELGWPAALTAAHLDMLVSLSASLSQIPSDHFSWREPGPEREHSDFPHPRVQARVVWDENYIAVIFQVADRFVQAKGTKFQDMVCLDSCCEFFVAPEATSTESSPYFNFEVSANGTMLVYFCQPAIGTQTPLPDFEWTRIKMAASLVDTPGTVIHPEITEPTTWQIEYHLPWTLFKKYFGTGSPLGGDAWSANFCESSRLLHVSPVQTRSIAGTRDVSAHVFRYSCT